VLATVRKDREHAVHTDPHLYSRHLESCTLNKDIAQGLADTNGTCRCKRAYLKTCKGLSFELCALRQRPLHSLPAESYCILKAESARIPAARIDRCHLSSGTGFCRSQHTSTVHAKHTRLDIVHDSQRYGHEDSSLGLATSRRS
jgi:hypothetical protein